MMMMQSPYMILGLLMLLGQQHHPMMLVEARPNGSPICPADEGAPGVSDSPIGPSAHQGADGQTLTEGNVVIEFGGETITPGATPVEVTAGVDLVVTVTATTFRGILARVGGGGDGYDTTGIFSVGNSGGALQISDPCLDLGVGGVTHTGREDKSSVTFTMETPDEVTTEPLALDLSLYTGFSGGASNIYFYGQLLINVVAAEGGNTTDTMAPTSAPGTTTDTMAPTMAPMAEAGSSVSSVTVSAFLMTLAAASAWMLF